MGDLGEGVLHLGNPDWGGGESKKFGNPGGRFFIIINIMNSIIFKYINNLKIAYVI